MNIKWCAGARSILLPAVFAALTGCVAGNQSGANAGSAPMSESSCRTGTRACPQSVDFSSAGSEQSATVHAALTAADPARCYRFCMSKAGSTLNWTLTGPVVHLVITDPKGDSQGPGIQGPLALASAGCYVLAVSADTMADRAFGEFDLKLWMTTK